ncbi:MAG TPA: lysylphosphatidylglycerol synthase domain-containing protein, partial [Patescibacteria group bacterium]
MLKKIASSKILRFIISAALVYFAFRKVDILKILGELKQVPLWFVAANIIYLFFVSMLGAYRWSLLLFKKVGWKQVFDFTKASYAGSFYALLFPTGVAGDLLKWLPLQKKYPELSKTRLISSALLDRVIGFTAFILVAFVSAIIGKLIHYSFPDYLFWLFGILFGGVV